MIGRADWEGDIVGVAVGGIGDDDTVMLSLSGAATLGAGDPMKGSLVGSAAPTAAALSAGLAGSCREPPKPSTNTALPRAATAPAPASATQRRRLGGPPAGAPSFRSAAIASSSSTTGVKSTGRSSGSLRSSPRMIGSTASGSDARTPDGGSGESFVCRSISSSASLPAKGGRPVSIS